MEGHHVPGFFEAPTTTISDESPEQKSEKQTLSADVNEVVEVEVVAPAASTAPKKKKGQKRQLDVVDLADGNEFTMKRGGSKAPKAPKKTQSFGKAGTRTAQQTKLANEHAKELVDRFFLFCCFAAICLSFCFAFFVSLYVLFVCIL